MNEFLALFKLWWSSKIDGGGSNTYHCPGTCAAAGHRLDILKLKNLYIPTVLSCLVNGCGSAGKLKVFFKLSKTGLFGGFEGHTGINKNGVVSVSGFNNKILLKLSVPQVTSHNCLIPVLLR